jgi:hypothetical protein
MKSLVGTEVLVLTRPTRLLEQRQWVWGQAVDSIVPLEERKRFRKQDSFTNCILTKRTRRFGVNHKSINFCWLTCSLFRSGRHASVGG